MPQSSQSGFYPPQIPSTTPSRGEPRFLDQVAQACRLKHLSYRTEQSYVAWVRRFILFHNKRHPRELGPTEVRAFLTHLAVNRRVSASTQNQALNAIVFMYREVVRRDPGEFGEFDRAKRPKRLPTVLTRDEVKRVLAHLEGTHGLMARAEDGEAFAILTSNHRLPTRVKLDLRLVEADQVTTPDLSLRWNAVDGIVFDEAGNPVEYHVLKQHPGDNRFGLASGVEYERLPAEAVIHWFRCDRPGQARGVPDIMPALPLFAQLRRFTLAVLAAAETAADFAGILYTDAPANGEADAAEPFEPIELEKRALLTMPGGWKMSQLQAEQPATTYAEFKREILNEIARCLNMPFNIAAGNSSGYNYASGRLDHQTYYKSLRVEQAHLEAVVLDRVLSAWLDEAVLIPELWPDGLGPFTDWPHQWFWDAPEHVDPAKEATAQATRLASMTTTLAYEYARQGRDWEEALRQRAKETALMRELGLPTAETTPKPPSDGEPTEEDDAEEEATHAAATA